MLPGLPESAGSSRLPRLPPRARPPPDHLTWSELGRRPSALREAPRGLPKSPGAAPGGCDLGPSCRPLPCSEAGRHPVTGGTARAAPSPARRAARSQAGLPSARPSVRQSVRPPAGRPPLPRLHGREGAEAAPAESNLPLLTPPRGKSAPPLSAPGPAARSRLALIYSRVQPAPPRPRWRRGAGPAERGSRAGLAGEARANPTGGGAPGCSMACCPPPPPSPPPGAPRGACIASRGGLEMGDGN